MNLFDRIEDYLFWAVTSLATALAAGFFYVVRLVFTSQVQIDLMEQSLKHRDDQLTEHFAHRDQLREEDRQAVVELRSDVKQLLRHVMGDDHRA
jgi:hypothetical protein